MTVQLDRPRVVVSRAGEWTGGGPPTLPANSPPPPLTKGGGPRRQPPRGRRPWQECHRSAPDRLAGNRAAPRCQGNHPAQQGRYTPEGGSPGHRVGQGGIGRSDGTMPGWRRSRSGAPRDPHPGALDPAEDREELNRHIVGSIEVVAELRSGPRRGPPGGGRCEEVRSTGRARSGQGCERSGPARR